MTETSEEMNTATGRRWLYGVNVALLVVVALAILGCLFYFTAQHSVHLDMTSAGLYSLSGSTKNLLHEIDQKKQTYQILSFFPGGPVGSDEDLHQQQVSDELDEYARNSSHIKVENASEVGEAEVRRRIRDIYAGEVKPYDDAIRDYDKVSQGIENFLKEEAANLGAAAQKPGTPPAVVRQAAQIQGVFTNALPADLSDLRPIVRKAIDSTLPKWTQIVDAVKLPLDKIIAQLQPLGDPKSLKDQFQPAIVDYFVTAAPRFKAEVATIKAYRDRLDKLQPLKVDAVLDSLVPDTVLILGPNSAKVISSSDLYVTAGPPQGSRQPSTTFAGETALSSALMAMVQPEKVKAVFVSPTPQQLTTGLYSEMCDLLRQANFDILEWSPPGPPAGPDQPPPSPTPPAEGHGVVWIVFPPAAPNQQMMMMGMPPPDPRPLIEATRKHLADGGAALFLADGSAGSFMGGGEYAYQSLLTDFGVEAQTKYTVVRLREGQDPDTGQLVRQTGPFIPVDRFLPDRITDPLANANLPVILAPIQGRAGYIGMPTVVSRAGAVPKDAEATVLFQTRDTSDYWGESNFSPDAKFDKAEDFAPPCPLAVAATRFKGQKDKEQRVVVIGSSTIAANPLLDEVAGYRITRNGPEGIPAYPGNPELFRNCVLWLAGYENMIAVSSKASVALRIHDISPGALAAIRWGILLGGAPIAALLLGGIVWFVRRR